MPPRRGHRKEALAPSTSASRISVVGDIDQAISEAISQWDSSGPDTVRTLLASQSGHSHASPFLTISLTHALACLVTSELEPEALATLLSSLIEGFSEDVREGQTEMVGEALVDVIEVLEEEREDHTDLSPHKVSMEVDGEGKKSKDGEKGLEVLKLLLVGSLPALQYHYTKNCSARSPSTCHLTSRIFCSAPSSCSPCISTLLRITPKRYNGLTSSATRLSFSSSPNTTCCASLPRDFPAS